LLVIPPGFSKTPVLSSFFHVNQCFIRAISHTGRNFFSLTQITPYSFLLSKITLYYSERTNQYTGPASYTFLFINLYYTGIRITAESTGQAGINTGLIITVLASYRE
jgi:hypothetical protein